MQWKDVRKIISIKEVTGLNLNYGIVYHWLLGINHESAINKPDQGIELSLSATAIASLATRG
jgi:hypothetical protein